MIKVICALGNPGQQYNETRHNLGFMVFDRLLDFLDCSWAEQSKEFDYFQLSVGSGLIYLVRPRTYVNDSGSAVVKVLQIFSAEPSQLFVILDDYHLDLGRIRIRKSGTSGGHNGLDSIIEELGTIDFPRLRIGIGPLPEDIENDHSRIPEFVLGRFRADETDVIENIIERSVKAVREVINNGLDMAINKYNATNPTPE